MKTLFIAVLSVLAALPASAADRYSVKDEGLFAGTGRHVEFADRFGWQSYQMKMDFAFVEGGRGITPDSTLVLTVRRRDGSKWEYRCRADDRRDMWANVNHLYGKGVQVLTTCRINAGKFARAVELDSDMVGEPTLIFSVMINEGKAQAGLQKGLYFLASGQIEASAMNAYATRNDDPSDLAVPFASSMMTHPYLHPYVPVPRFVP